MTHIFRSSAELSPKGSDSPLNKSHESPTFEGDKSLAASNSPDQQYALGTLQKIVELPQEDTLSARLKKKAGTVEEVIDQSLMKNPMTLFNHVIKEQDVDTQTKLDLYLCISGSHYMILTSFYRWQQKASIKRLYRADRI